MANAPMSNLTERNQVKALAGLVFNTSGSNPIPAGFSGMYADANSVLQSVDSAGNTSPIVGEELTTVTADAAISAGQWVYVSAANHANLAVATAASTLAFGVAPAAIANAAKGPIQSSGIFTTTGLTAGSLYYLSPSVAGSITATVPATVGQFVQVVGIALSTTQLLIVNSPDTLALGIMGVNTLDATTAATLLIGPTTATGLTLGAAGYVPNAPGGLTIGAGKSFDTAAGGSLTIGGTTATSVNIGRSGQSIGFFGATAVVQQAASANAAITAAGSTAANRETTYTGGVGSSAFSVGGLVLALKNLGLIAQ